MVRTIAFVCTIVALFSVARCQAGVTDPLKEGPYPVGVTTTVLVDMARTDHFTTKPRTLITEIWYPATNAAYSMPKSKFADFIPGGSSPAADAYSKAVTGKNMAELNKSYWMNSHRDAPIRGGKYPLIVFSHGNGGNRMQNTFWCDFIASHGYIVVSADHTGNAGITFLKEGPVPYQAGERANSAVDRPKDMIYLLDQMEKWNSGAGPSSFKGHFDLSNVVAAGMSFGSMTAVKVASMDKRFKVVIAMSGAYPDETGVNPTVPTLWMIGTEDRTIGVIGNAIVRNLHAKHTGPSYLLELKNGGHYSFTDMAKMNPNFGDGVGSGKRNEGGAPFLFTNMETTYNIINSYSVAFLGVYVKGDTTLSTYLHRNGWPTELDWQYRYSK